MTKALELLGRRFGRLVVLSRNGSNKKGSALWLCLCDCGSEKNAVGSALNDGLLNSCGCYEKECRDGRYTRTHGMKNTPEYRAWTGMKKRCENPREKSYIYYGARGIEVCAEWRKDFVKFFSDMGPRPEGFSLDRIDVDGNYCPENCRWTDDKTQQRNKTNSRRLTYKGQTLCVAEWGEKLEMPGWKISSRLALGWSVERALSLSGKTC